MLLSGLKQGWAKVSSCGVLSGMFIQRAGEVLLSAPELCCVFALHFPLPLFEVQFRQVLCCEADQSIARDVRCSCMCVVKWWCVRELGKCCMGEGESISLGCCNSEEIEQSSKLFCSPSRLSLSLSSSSRKRRIGTSRRRSLPAKGITTLGIRFGRFLGRSCCIVVFPLDLSSNSWVGSHFWGSRFRSIPSGGQ
jgi:hypothetical protein